VWGGKGETNTKKKYRRQSPSKSGRSFYLKKKVLRGTWVSSLLSLFLRFTTGERQIALASIPPQTRRVFLNISADRATSCLLAFVCCSTVFLCVVSTKKIEHFHNIYSFKVESKFILHIIVWLYLKWKNNIFRKRLSSSVLFIFFVFPFLKEEEDTGYGIVYK
jgi:hypothetical protein